MGTRELKIHIPEGQEIDWQESAKQEKVIFKPIDAKPRSWEEYCDNFKGEVYYIRDNRDNIGDSFTATGLISAYKNTLPTKELAEAFLAMMQLMSLRQAWVVDWQPDWNMFMQEKYCIIGIRCGFEVCLLNKCRYALSFPTEEMATDFMNCFKGLLEIAKPLI